MIRTFNLFFWFSLSIVASLALYHTSDSTRELQHQLSRINASIETEQEKIHVLKAEWVYLGNPTRVEAMAKKYLPLKPSTPKQVISLDDLATALPTSGEKTAIAQAASPMPIPIVKAAVKVAATAKAEEKTVVAEAEPSTPIPTAKPSFSRLAQPARVAIRETEPRKIALAVADRHINERMTLDHTAKPQSMDQIGSLIAKLESQP